MRLILLLVAISSISPSTSFHLRTFRRIPNTRKLTFLRAENVGGNVGGDVGGNVESNGGSGAGSDEKNDEKMDSMKDDPQSKKFNDELREIKKKVSNSVGVGKVGEEGVVSRLFPKANTLSGPGTTRGRRSN
jgi:hypothetical protein